jgi:two-component system cell cycle sensor histidine kinase/response regulator CckA
MSIFSKKHLEKNVAQADGNQFLIDLALSFIDLSAYQLHNKIEDGLGSLARFLHVDRSYIYRFDDNFTTMHLAYEWLAVGIKRKIEKHEQIQQTDFSWMMDLLKANQAVMVTDLEHTSGISGSMKAILKSEEVQAQLLSPMYIDASLIGLLGIDKVDQKRNWTPKEQTVMRQAAGIFVKVIQLKTDSGLKQKADQKMRALFERTEDVVFISNPEGKLLEINPAGAKLFGYKSAKEMEQVDIINEFYYDAIDRERYQAVLEHQGSVRNYELALKRKDGKKIIVLETTTAVKDENGKTIAYEGIMRDVTEQRQLEQQLFQSQKMESVGLLAGGIAHDFNNILTAITGYADMILMDLSPDHPYYKHVASILRGSKKAENLIKQLLAFSRKQIIEPKVVSINQVISDIFKMLRRLVSEDIHLNMELKNNISFIEADPVQIQQILVNLTVNAEHAIKENKDEKNAKYITISTDEVNFDDHFLASHPGSKKGKYISIAVKDTGIGIKKALHQKIFEPFFTTRSDGKGTGLGLSTVYGIIKQNNAYIYVNSEPGRGAIFTIYWPVSDKKELSYTKIDNFVEFGKQNELVLVVEDDPTVRDMAVKALETFGYKVYKASNGKEALELITKEKLLERLDLLLTDIIMPEMDGMELARRINKLNPKIKILLCSGYTESRVFSEDKQEFELIVKPYSVNSLNRKIREILDK